MNVVSVARSVERGGKKPERIVAKPEKDRVKSALMPEGKSAVRSPDRGAEREARREPEEKAE
jgi:hypothetical protein